MYKQLNLVPIYNIIFYVWCSAHGVAGCVWGGGGWVSVDRRLFHRCGASVDLELSCLETLLSLEVKGSSDGILYDEIYNGFLTYNGVHYKIININKSHIETNYHKYHFSRFHHLLQM